MVLSVAWPLFVITVLVVGSRWIHPRFVTSLLAVRVKSLPGTYFFAFVRHFATATRVKTFSVLPTPLPALPIATLGLHLLISSVIARRRICCFVANFFRRYIPLPPLPLSGDKAVAPMFNVVRALYGRRSLFSVPAKTGATLSGLPQFSTPRFYHSGEWFLYFIKLMRVKILLA